MAKSERYFFDAEAIKESSSCIGKTKTRFGGNKYGDSNDPKHNTKSGKEYTDIGTRNKRSVWTISPKPFKGSHFATMPPDLAELCIKAGSKPGDCVLDPFGGAGTTALAAEKLGRDCTLIELNADYIEIAKKRVNEFSSCRTPSLFD